MTVSTSSSLRGAVLSALALVLLLGLSACDESIPSGVEPEQETIGETLRSGDIQNLDEFALVADSVGLYDEVLDDEDGTYTVFVSTLNDIEFEPLLPWQSGSPELLSTVLEYHIVEGQALTMSDLEGGQTLQTLSGTELTVQATSDTTLVADDQPFDVGAANVQASNGVFHVIERTLRGGTTIANRVILTPALSQLETALAREQLVSTFQGSGPFTVFAPTNDAFLAALDANGDGEIEASEYPDNLGSILQHHVVQGNVRAGDLENGQELVTLNNDTLTVGISDGTVTVDNATVVAPNLKSTNGVSHGIDAVLLP
jgi:uncharacterized surface protein with fasciclin (FAS1) repeats